MTTEADIDRWLLGRENEQLEFKQRSNSMELDEIVRYCVAIANEGGGKLVVGVSDKPPRRVVGTLALRDPEIAHRVLQRIQLRVEVEEVQHRDGRVVVVHIPSRGRGQPIHDAGRYLVRVGENLVPMMPAQLKQIFEEADPDFSASTISRGSRFDLDDSAVQRFRDLWARRAGRPEMLEEPAVVSLQNAELLVDGIPTVAALILFGKPESLSRLLAQSELVHEFRDSPDDLRAAKRVEFRAPFMLSVDDIWRSVNAFNREKQFEDGFFKWSIPMFREQVVREAVLNAVAHRDYRSQAAVFVRQTPTDLVVTSPGGFPPTVTPENILTKSVPRNRRLAEALSRCGLVERAGSGADLMFRAALSDGKPTPDFSDSTGDEVVLRLRGQVQHPDFVRFLQEVARERNRSFGVTDLLLLDQVHREQTLDAEAQRRAAALEQEGVLESHGRGRARRWLLASRFYALARRSGEYTRRRGLNRGEQELLLLKHLQTFGPTSMAQLLQVVTALDRKGVHRLLNGLREQGKVILEGTKRGAKWRLVGSDSEIVSRISGTFKPAKRGQNPPDKKHE